MFGSSRNRQKRTIRARFRWVQTFDFTTLITRQYLKQRLFGCHLKQVDSWRHRHAALATSPTSGSNRNPGQLSNGGLQYQ
jgi:hypothetical protein